MIVLDEHFDDVLVLLPLLNRLRSRVVSIRELRPGTVIKDEDIPALLRQYKNPTFVTANVTDFWRKVRPHDDYCLICVPLATQRQGEIPSILQAFLKHPEFRTARQRMGKIIRLNRNELLYYTVEHGTVAKVPW